MAAAHNNLGFVYYDLENYQAAAYHQGQALAIDANYANAHYGMAMARKALGQVAESRHHWQAYLSLEPSGHFARRAEEELRALPPDN